MNVHASRVWAGLACTVKYSSLTLHTWAATMPAGSHITNMCAHRGESACWDVYEWQRVMICQQIVLVCPSQQVSQVCRGVLDPACAPLHQKPLKGLHKITQNLTQSTRVDAAGNRIVSTLHLSLHSWL